MRVKNHDLEAALGLHRKNNKDVSQLLQAVTSQNKNAMMEEDVKEKNKVSCAYKLWKWGELFNTFTSSLNSEMFSDKRKKIEKGKKSVRMNHYNLDVS